MNVENEWEKLSLCKHELVYLETPRKVIEKLPYLVGVFRKEQSIRLMNRNQQFLNKSQFQDIMGEKIAIKDKILGISRNKFHKNLMIERTLRDPGAH